MRPSDWLALRAAERPGALAIATPEERLDYGALDRRVAALAAALAARGARAGARLAIALPSGLGLAEALLATLRLGAVAVLVDGRLPAREGAAVALATGIDLVLGARATEGLAEALARAADAPLLLRGPSGPDLEQARAGLASPVRARPSRDGESRPPDGSRKRRSPGPHDRSPSPGHASVTAAASSLWGGRHGPAVVVLTSGTTAAPRPIELTLGNLEASARASAARLGARRDDRWLACLPLSHVGGLSILLRSLRAGSAVLLRPRFEVDDVMRAFGDEGATLVSLVPTTLARLLDRAGLDRGSAPRLRCALIGGAAAPLGLLREARERGVPVAPTYGLTEAASQVATLAPSEPLGREGAVGPPLSGTEVRIVDAGGRPLGVDQEGRIEVGGPTVAPCTRRRDGWLATGDRGLLDRSGGLTVRGRADDVIVTGGENVSPAEVEAVLARLPGVAEVAVAGVADAEWGEVVGAWVVPEPGAALDLPRVREAARSGLAPHKLPRRLYLAPSLPRTALGKLRRGALRVPRPG